MYNEKFVSIHIPKNNQEKDIIRDAQELDVEVLIVGKSYISYYPISDRMSDAERRGEFYSQKYSGKILICSRFKELFFIELFEAGEMLAQVLWMESEVANTLKPQLILGDIEPEKLIDESLYENGFNYRKKEDFEKIDLFLQRKYHLYVDEPQKQQLKKLKLLEHSGNLFIYDGRNI